MKNKPLAILLVAVLVAGIAAAGYYFLFFQRDNAGNTVAGNTFGWKYPVVKFPVTGSGDIAFSDIRDPGGIPQGLPVRLQIPVIGVDSAIEDALITPDGRMDVPSGSIDVAWFALGPHPGQVGSAVIGGHFGIQNGIPFVFYNLDKLRAGDKMYVLDDKGDTLAFMVRATALFDRNADATTVFTSKDGLAHLNLITCEGIWNQVNGVYPLRRVVFADLIPAEGAAPAAVPAGGPSAAAPVFSRPLGAGASGTDVGALQAFLEQRGLLELPPGATNGFFGPLTRAAVAKYQVSEGLQPATGFFGPLTRAKILASFGSNPVLPNTGPRIVAVPSGVNRVPASPQALVQLIGDLFATPFDGFVTSLLLLLIAFVIFKIIRR